MFCQQIWIAVMENNRLESYFYKYSFRYGPWVGLRIQMLLFNVYCIYNYNCSHLWIITIDVYFNKIYISCFIVLFVPFFYSFHYILDILTNASSFVRFTPVFNSNLYQFFIYILENLLLNCSVKAKGVKYVFL